MEYYYLTMNGNMKNPLKVEGLDTNYYRANISQEQYERIPKGMITYYDYSVDMELPDLVTRPVVLCTEQLKDTLTMYSPQIQGKPVQFFTKDRTNNFNFLYWFLWIEQLECLHPGCEWNPNGSIRELMLDGAKLQKQDVFRVKGIREDRIIVTLPVVESILRRHLYGIGFEKVKVL